MFFPHKYQAAQSDPPGGFVAMDVTMSICQQSFQRLLPGSAKSSCWCWKRLRPRKKRVFKEILMPWRVLFWRGGRKQAAHLPLGNLRLNGFLVPPLTCSDLEPCIALPELGSWGREVSKAQHPSASAPENPYLSTLNN